jgi:hypothetical protein
MLTFNAAGRLSHTLSAPASYPTTDLIWAKLTYPGTSQVLFSEVQVAAGRRIKQFTAFRGNASGIDAGSLTTFGAVPQAGCGEDLGNGSAAEPVMVVHNSDTSITIFTANFPSGVNNTGTNTNASDWSAADTLLVGSLYIDGAYQDSVVGDLGEYTRWAGAACDATDFAAILAGAAGETIRPSFLYDVWDMNPAGSAGSAVTGTLVGRVNGRVMTITGTVTKASRTHPITRGPVITGPSGAAGAGSSTANLAELATTGPTFTTSTTLGGGYPSLTGTDAALFAITTLSSTSFRVDPVTPFNFESLPHSNPFNVTFNASASVSQTCAITVTNVNEAPTFSGTVSVPTLTQGTAMTPVDAGALFSDQDAGDTATYSAVGVWPAGVTVNSSTGQISGTPSAAAVYANLAVRRTDSGSLTVDSNLFTITVVAPGGDATPPTQSGGISIGSVTSSSIQMSWPAGSDNVAVTSYEVSSNGGSSYTDVGNVLTYTFTGLTPSTSYPLRVRAKDAAGNVSTPALAATQSTSAASGVYGFDFNTAAGFIFGSVSGSLTGLGLQTGVSIKVRAYNPSTGALAADLGNQTTGLDGRLPRMTHASLDNVTTYQLMFTWPDGSVDSGRLGAT